MTFSVVARDKKTGQLWVAVQTHWFGVGNNVPWLEAGVWAIATQAQTNMDYGKKWLELLKAWRLPQDVFEEISWADESKENRQVAIIDAQGSIYAHTWKDCVKYADYLVWDCFVVQGNILSNENVLPAMKKAYEDYIDIDFAVRLMYTLHAGQDAGWELRGQQSAALRIVPWEKDRYDAINLRVDNDENPLDKMWGQLDICRAYNYLMKAEDAWDIWDIKKSLELFQKVFQIMPDSEEALFWKAFMLLNNWKSLEAEQIFNQFSPDSKWKELRTRLQ